MSQQQIINTTQDLNNIKFKPLTINKWLESRASKPLRFLWLGKVGKLYTSVVLLSDKITPNDAKSIANQIPQVTFY